MSYITISRDNYFYNLNLVREKVESIDNIAVVLKDNAYGHGLETIAQLAKEFGIDRAVVRRTAEAKIISKYFKYILILAPEFIENQNNFYYTINSLDDIYKYPKNINIELKVDSGMHRLGISPMQLYFALNLIKSRGLRLRGFFTHFREADELGSSLFVQREHFNLMIKDVVNSCFNDINFHSNNSAGIFRSGKKIKNEMVRVGIASYGYILGNSALKFPELKPVLSLWGEKVGELKYLKDGFRIGYGGISTVSGEKYISIYDIGYSDGFRRLPENIIKNKLFRTPDNNYVLGKISMDSMAINSNRDEVEIFRSASELAKIFGTTEYEILVNLSDKIKRIII